MAEYGQGTTAMGANIYMTYLLIALGGAMGSVFRYISGVYIANQLQTHFPFGTLIINMLGALLIGIIAGLSPKAEYKALLIVGLCGGFTTFSAFSLETLYLFQQQKFLFACLNIASSVLSCILMSYVGLKLGSISLRL